MAVVIWPSSPVYEEMARAQELNRRSEVWWWRLADALAVLRGGAFATWLLTPEQARQEEQRALAEAILEPERR
jgi:hypothetical protein